MNKNTFPSISAILGKNFKWKGNKLQLLAERNSLLAVSTEDLLRTDLTHLFLEELRREIQMKEIIKIVINGKMRLSKSTVGIALGAYLHHLLQEIYPVYTKGKKFGVWNIARDEQEYVSRMRDPSLMYDVVIVDERNALDDTGENATVEKSQREMFSDIQAARYVHTIMITPEKDMDDNNDIKLVIRNKQDGFSHCRLYYRLFKGGYSQWTLLGIVNLDVRNLIKNWIKYEERFMKWIKGDYKDRKEKEKR